MTAAEKFEIITKAIEAGKTVYIQSHLRISKITPKSVKGFADAGRDMFKLHNGSLYMSQGKGYVCIDFNGIATQ